MDRQFLLAQQKRLGIDSSFLKSARRIASDFGRASPNERNVLSARLAMSQRVDGKFRSDISKKYVSGVKKDLGGSKGMNSLVKRAGLFATGYALATAAHKLSK
jgi:hypothetical protein